MKKLFLILLLLVIPIFSHALDVPALRGHVNDYAGMLSPAALQRLESELTAFERSDTTQIVVLTIPTLDGENLEEYSIKVAEAWQIGRQGRDNGVILLIAQQERKIRIEVGRGLEGTLTDLLAGRIIRNEITPGFKSGDFDRGIEQGISSIMTVVRGEYRAAAESGRPAKQKASPVFTLFIFFLVACVFLGAISRVLGGLAGAVGLPLIVAAIFPGLALLVLAGIAVVGFLFGLFLTFLFGAGGHVGRFGGGPFGGGGFGGGSFGGGGGGFSGGGGSFGGGGASGNW